MQSKELVIWNLLREINQTISNLQQTIPSFKQDYLLICCSFIIDLAMAMPEEHKRFLRDLVWIHEEVGIIFIVRIVSLHAKGIASSVFRLHAWQENVPIDTDEGQIICNLIAVHAGLEKSIDLNEQLRVLRTRDTRVPKVPMLSGRQDVWNTPKVSYYVILFLSISSNKKTCLTFNISLLVSFQNEY